MKEKRAKIQPVVDLLEYMIRRGKISNAGGHKIFAFALDHVDLEIRPDAMETIAQKAVDRQIGARGLRAIMEKIMTKIMYRIPSDLSIRKVIITPECVEGGEPELIRDTTRPREKLGSRR